MPREQDSGERVGVQFHLCVRCGRATPAAANEFYCPNDGSPLLVACPNCDSPVTSPYARYCPGCGHEYAKQRAGG